MQQALPPIQQQSHAPSSNIQSDQIQNPLIEPSSLENISPSRTIHRKQYYIKLACVVFLASGFVLYRFGNFVNINTSCILDAYQDYTFSLNRKLDEGWDNTVLGIGQVIMDFWIPFSAVFWMIVIKNMRFPIAVFTFYMVRSAIMVRFGLMQQFTKFPFPPNMVWHDPGFYSFTVPYDRTRDFFYSGHTGALVLIMLQFSQLTVLHSRKPAGYVWIIVFTCLIYIMNMLIVTRVHYTIDVAGGLIYSVYCYWLIGVFTERIDRIISAPYKYAIKPLIQKVRERRMRRNLTFDESEGTMRESLNDKLVNESSERDKQ